jgi:Uma2 family endonuclease
MLESAPQKATYEDLFSIPENMTGEIIDGELIVTPRPSGEHSNAAFALSAAIGPPYRFGRGGPGGWIILYGPEVKFDEDILVPDLAGWRNERFPGWPKNNWFSVVPDWICEIVSPSTARNDRIKKMRIYARHQVQYFWLIDPRDKTLEVFKLKSGEWAKLAGFADNDKVQAEPFLELEFQLDDLWADVSSNK